MRSCREGRPRQFSGPVLLSRYRPASESQSCGFLASGVAFGRGILTFYNRKGGMDLVFQASQVEPDLMPNHLFFWLKVTRRNSGTRKLLVYLGTQGNKFLESV